MQTRDPLELMIAEGLRLASVHFIHESDAGKPGSILDFYLPDFFTHIECKQFATDRTERQLMRFDNVILIQGRGAAGCFVRLLKEISDLRKEVSDLKRDIERADENHAADLIERSELDNM